MIFSINCGQVQAAVVSHAFALNGSLHDVGRCLLLRTTGKPSRSVRSPSARSSRKKFFLKKTELVLEEGVAKLNCGSGNQFLVLKFACAGVLNFMVSR